MIGYGAGLYSQGNFNKGVMGGWVKTSASVDVQVANYAIWSAYPKYSIYATGAAFFFGGLTQGSFALFQGTTTMYASNIKMTWDGNLDLGSGTSTMYSSGFIAWDGQSVDDASWTTQTVE